jgi:hypothetical protein
VPLQGSPQQVNDLQLGAPQIICHSGWNMIANPYNYAIPVGQLVGVPESDNQHAYTFQELASQNIISGYLASWDPVTQGYKYTTLITDLMQPNTGYWLFVQSDQDLVLNYPPVFQAFIPGLPDPGGFVPKRRDIKSPLAGSPEWALQLVASSNGIVDNQSFVGQAASATMAKNLTRFKPPVAPTKNAISGSFVVQSGRKTQMVGRALATRTTGTQTWNWQVKTNSAGNVTITWPTMSIVPNNVQIKLVDMVNGVQKNLRQVNSYTFAGKANSTHAFSVVVTTGPALPVISSVSAMATRTSLNGTYVLSVSSATTVNVMQSGQVIATLVSNRSDSAGTSTATWNYMDAANRKVRPGVYQLVVSSTPSGGATETKAISFVVSR